MTFLNIVFILLIILLSLSGCEGSARLVIGGTEVVGSSDTAKNTIQMEKTK